MEEHFLDEIGDMPIDAQTRLLRVLQEGEFLTVGGTSPIKTNVRIIAATNKSLGDQIKLGAFPRGLVLQDKCYSNNITTIKGTKRRSSFSSKSFYGKKKRSK